VEIITVRTVLPAICMFIVLSGLPGLIQASESRPNTVEIWGGVASWSGEDAEGFEPGPGTGATLLFHIGLPVQFGFEAAFARMDTDQFIDEVDEVAISGVIRYRFLKAPLIAPFLGVQAGYTRLSADYSDLKFEQNGWFAGGHAGFEVPLRSRVMLAFTGGMYYYGYSDTTIFLEDVPLPSTGGNAWRYWGRLGLSFHWGL